MPAEQPVEMFRTLGVREMGSALWGTQERCVREKVELRKVTSLTKSQGAQAVKMYIFNLSPKKT